MNNSTLKNLLNEIAQKKDILLGALHYPMLGKLENVPNLTVKSLFFWVNGGIYYNCVFSLDHRLWIRQARQGQDLDPVRNARVLGARDYPQQGEELHHFFSDFAIISQRIRRTWYFALLRKGFKSISILRVLWHLRFGRLFWCLTRSLKRHSTRTM